VLLMPVRRRDAVRAGAPAGALSRGQDSPAAVAAAEGEVAPASPTARWSRLLTQAAGPRPGALATLMVGAGLCLLPWLAYLAVSLPASPHAAHWPAVWAGLDALEAAGLISTGLLLRRGDSRYCLTAVATAAFLLTDAWFDVLTAPPGAGQRESMVLALAAELPVAAGCAALAVRGVRLLLAGKVVAAPQLARSDRLSGVRVLVIGSGGREHALARALAADPGVTQLHAAPGNPGIAALAEQHQLTATDPVAVADLAAWLRADLVVVGPEAPLVAGAADAVRAAGICCFGPGQGAAMIEGSKSFAKDVMRAAGVPTAAARTCTTEAEVSAALDEFGPPFVVKADGLAAGKGVVVTSDRQAALRHAAASGTVVVEEFLDGPEVSVFALTDGTSAVPLLPAQDYKRAGDGDEGPNTGGMGAYAPLPWAPPGLADEVMAAVVAPALAELAGRGAPFTGLLYTGLCLTSRGPRVVEFNARFGDPETQVVLDRLGTPLGGLLQAAAAGDLAAVPAPAWRDGAAVAVVVAAEGYPAAPAAGDVIEGIDAASGVPGAHVLHAGTATGPDGQLMTAGGRVLNVVGSGPDLASAREIAYDAAAQIRIRGGWFRGDIAARPAAGTATGI
jgi:phosphoribosylamine--glycine ligase